MSERPANTTFGKKPDDFDIQKYNYVVYRIDSDRWPSITYSQPFTIEIEEMPGNNGQVVSFAPSSSISLVYDDETGTYKSNRTFPASAGAASNMTLNCSWYFVVAYERDPTVDYNTTEVTYENTMTIRI